ncbi:MAG TPA: hypothetical protein VGG09_16215 [Acidimicrobiales bacterium]|jgi:hypothetical protein
MSSDVIGSRYRLGGVVTCTPESTTWQARDTWLDERVLVVTPEPGCDARFAALASAVMDHASAHLVGAYDIGTTPNDFVVFSLPAATLSDERVPLEEEDVLVAGRSLGDALEALHGRGVVHGDLHPGSVAVAESGDTALSPWPLAPRPQNWSGPGGFGSDPEEWRDATAEDDVRALGAVLLGALAGPPVLSSEQVGNLERELSVRAPSAVAIADRALTPPARGGYGEAAQLRDDCAAALSGRLVVEAPASSPASVRGRGRGGGAVDRDREVSEGRRAALVVVAAGAAVLAGLGLSGAFGASARLGVHPVTTQASGCVGPHCPGSDPGVPQVSAPPAAASAPKAPRGAGTTARLADQAAAARSGAGEIPSPVPAHTPATSSTLPPAASTTTTPPPSTTTSSSPTTSSTTTSTSSTTTTTTVPASTTTSSSTPSSIQAGPSGNLGGPRAPRSEGVGLGLGQGR